MTTKYVIEPADGTKFHVVEVQQGWLRAKRKPLVVCERLQEAEMWLARELDRQYLQVLDRRYFKPQEFQLSDCEPRDCEVPTYVVLVLAECKPPGRHEGGPWLEPKGSKKEEIITAAFGEMSYIERRMFESRFMSWYARENKDYYDPRRDAYYNDDSPSNGYAPLNAPTPAAGMTRAIARLFGRNK